jgi:hypothetical protein
MGGLECRPAAQSQRRSDGDAVERHGKVAARKAVPVHVTRYGSAPSYRFIDLFPVDLLGAGGGTKCRHSANRKHVNGTHDDVLLN